MQIAQNAKNWEKDENKRETTVRNRKKPTSFFGAEEKGIDSDTIK